MFGYVTIHQEGLGPEAVSRYSAYYCGLCRAIKARHGNLARVTLSYDMTFLLILLSALYEPEETQGTARCLPHPVKAKPYLGNALATYAADMNVALAYYKCLDNWQDERKVMSLAQSRLLKRAFARVEAQYPEKCKVISQCLRSIGDVEQDGAERIDSVANATGRMLGEIYAYNPGDVWAEDLRAMGEAMGRFIYMMDAYEDLPDDLQKHTYNPLTSYAKREDYEEFCREGLSMLIAECADAFEVLPIVQDADILRNILYTGVWSRYAAIQQKKAKKEEKA